MNDPAALFQLIDAKLKEKEHILLAIDGKCAAGKSNFAQTLANKYTASVFHMDDFYLPHERKTPGRLAQPGGNSDWERFEREVLRELASHRSFTYNAYNCHTGGLHPVFAKTKPLSIVEGAYSLHPMLSRYYDIKVFMDIAPDIQKKRILQRNGEEVLEQFITKWIPLENAYIDSLDIKNQCDIAL